MLENRKHRFCGATITVLNVNHDPLALGDGGKVAGSIVIVGDTAHNFAGGILTGVSGRTDIQRSDVTSIAVAVHEIPLELGDFVILSQGGFPRV